MQQLKESEIPKLIKIAEGFGRLYEKISVLYNDIRRSNRDSDFENFSFEQYLESMVSIHLKLVNSFAPGTFLETGPGLPNEKTPSIGVILLLVEQEYAVGDE